jgi:hypothetical protein
MMPAFDFGVSLGSGGSDSAECGCSGVVVKHGARYLNVVYGYYVINGVLMEFEDRSRVVVSAREMRAGESMHDLDDEEQSAGESG